MLYQPTMLLCALAMAESGGHHMNGAAAQCVDLACVRQQGQSFASSGKRNEKVQFFFCLHLGTASKVGCPSKSIVLCSWIQAGEYRYASGQTDRICCFFRRSGYGIVTESRGGSGNVSRFLIASTELL